MSLSGDLLKGFRGVATIEATEAALSKSIQESRLSKLKC